MESRHTSGAREILPLGLGGELVDLVGADRALLTFLYSEDRAEQIGVLRRDVLDRMVQRAAVRGIEETGVRFHHIKELCLGHLVYTDVKPTRQVDAMLDLVGSVIRVVQIRSHFKTTERYVDRSDIVGTDVLSATEPHHLGNVGDRTNAGMVKIRKVNLSMLRRSRLDREPDVVKRIATIQGGRYRRNARTVDDQMSHGSRP